MIKIEDFKNVPIGATATRADGGRAMKMNDGMRGWITPKDSYLSDKGMMIFGYVLDPSPATAAREALDLAWVLAHPVKEGQTIPKGTQILMLHSFGLKEVTTQNDVVIRPHIAPITRTVEPLPEPDPKPDWLDAPAVLAVHESHTKPSIWGKHWDQETLSEFYQSALTAETAHWSELHDVVPLYPEGEKA